MSLQSKVEPAHAALQELREAARTKPGDAPQAAPGLKTSAGLSAPEPRAVAELPPAWVVVPLEAWLRAHSALP
jgi:hypothetical protein